MLFIPRSPDVEWPEAIPYPVFAIAVHFFLDDCGIDDGPTAVVPGSQVWMVLIAAPGAESVGAKPPSSRGPREENGIMAYDFRTAEP